MSKNPKVVAVVDDDPSVRRSAGRLLSLLGYIPELYASAEEFFDAAMGTKAICLILDIELGGSSGIELARRLRNAGCAIPVIFMTGDRDNESYKRLALEVGCVAFFHKSVSADALIEALLNIPGRP
jgi:FixJ family two-component response regulator